MEEINNLLMTDISCDHSIKLLQKVITSIESYPTLYEFKQEEQASVINKDKKKEIKRDYNFYQQKINNSNINKIKKLLSEIEITLNLIYKTKYNDITKNKIEIINNHVIKELYSEEISALEKKLNEQKRELKKELNNLDKSLKFNLSFTKEGNKIILDENIETKTNVKELLEKVSIDKLIDEIDLENHKVIYYKELYGDPLDITYKNLFLSKENRSLNSLREQLYPILKVIKKLKKYYPDKYSELEKQSIKTSNLAIKVAQLENLNETIKTYNFKKLSNYLTKSINSLNKVINYNNDIITKIINNIIPEENEIYKLNEKEQEVILDILNELLNITSEEAERKYQEYGNFTTEAILNYQQILLTVKYNINFSVSKIINIINKRKEQPSIKEAPKTTFIKKLKKIKYIPLKK